MRALVTGSAGFVGRHMVAELVGRGYDVDECDIAADRPDDALDVFRRCERRYDLVVHCAAREPHRAAIDGRPAAFPYNVQLDSALFDWAIRTGQRRVLYLSSSAVYPVGMQAGHQPYRLSEHDGDRTRQVSADLMAAIGSWARLDPDARYGWTKLIGEQMAAAAAEAGVAVHVVRPFSGYGEDQGEDWPFGAFVARARRREDPFVIWGDGTQVRDWIHVDDVVRGALAVVDADHREPVNLCTGEGTSMAELVGMICGQVGYRPDVELLLDKPSGVAFRVGAPARFHEIYTPTVTLSEGIKRAFA